MLGHDSGLGVSLHDSLGGLSLRRPPPEDPHFDITAMIDLVFMMNIYFMFTFLSAAAGELDLPSANHCGPLDAKTATVISILNSAQYQQVDVIVGEDRDAPRITDPDEQFKAVQDAISKGLTLGKTAVLVKAEHSVRLRELRRICGAASDIPEVSLHLAVIEKDNRP
jgi:biopolymer transport protein ExbD